MATVTVGCKLPHGLVLKVGDTKVILKGANSSRIVGGYGLTPNVDKEFFDAWLVLNSQAAVVKRSLVFSQDSVNKAESQAKEQAEVKSGLEGINPEKPGSGVKPEKYEGKKKEED